MGKYTEVVKGLPKFLGPDAAFQDRVKQVKEIASTTTLPTDLKDKDGDPIALDSEMPGVYKEVILESIEMLRIQLLYYKFDMRTDRYPHAYVESRSIIESIEYAMKKLGELKEAYKQLIVADFEKRVVQSVRLPDGLLSYNAEPYAKITDKEAYRQWCLDNDYAESMQLPWQKTNAILKERLLAGEDEMDGVEAHSYDKLRLTRKG